MNPQPIPTIATTNPVRDRVLRAFGDELTVLLDGEQTGGAMLLGVINTSPGGGPPPHYHLNEDEWFLVQEGRASFFVGGQWQEVPTGTRVFLPRTVVHTFKNIGDQPLRMLFGTVPAGFEKFFVRCADECAKPNGPNMERIAQIAAEHGIHFAQP